MSSPIAFKNNFESDFCYESIFFYPPFTSKIEKSSKIYIYVKYIHQMGKSKRSLSLSKKMRADQCTVIRWRSGIFKFASSSLSFKVKGTIFQVTAFINVSLVFFGLASGISSFKPSITAKLSKVVQSWLNAFQFLHSESNTQP